jgi:hypothetical protein
MIPPTPRCQKTRPRSASESRPQSVASRTARQPTPGVRLASAASRRQDRTSTPGRRPRHRPQSYRRRPPPRHASHGIELRFRSLALDATGSEPRSEMRHGQNDLGLAVGRRNYLFAGSHTGARPAAIAYSILATCHLLGINPTDYLADVLAWDRDDTRFARPRAGSVEGRAGPRAGGHVGPRQPRAGHGRQAANAPRLGCARADRYRRGARLETRSDRSRAASDVTGGQLESTLPKGT